MSATAFRVCVLLAACTVGIAPGVRADPVVIYSNLGPDPGYLEAPAGSDIRPFYTQSDTSLFAMGFMLSTEAQLSSITVPVLWGGQVAGGVLIWIVPTVNGQPELGTCAIECWSVDVPAGAAPRTVSVITVDSASRPLLSADAQYFLAVYARAPGFDVIHWPWNNSGAEGVYGSFGPAGPSINTGPLGAFQLTGEPSPVPEPATILLFAAGSGVMLQRVRRRRAITKLHARAAQISA